jgi:hypothetical protein
MLPNRKQTIMSFFYVICSFTKNLRWFFYCFFCFLFFTPHFSISQTSNPRLPVFNLQGNVKLENKSSDGVSLELSKDGKQISKIITRKNGLYSFQMNRDLTDTGAEYVLDIIKVGAISGILRINTYSPKNEFNNVPYIFNLDIKLNLRKPSDVISKQDFGKIKWNPERGVFDFDKDYVAKIATIKDSLKTDSAIPPFAILDKIMKDAEEIEKMEKEQLKQKTETINTQQLVNIGNSTPLYKEKETVLKKKDVLQEEKEKAEINKKAISTNTEQFVKTEIKTKGPNKKSEAANLKTETNLPIKKTDVLSEFKTNNNANTLSSIKTNKINTENKKESHASSVKVETSIKETTNNSLQQITSKERPKTAVPNAKINTNSFDGISIFSINNEKSKLLEAKERMERKKTANLAKKYETSNILTSLLDVVEEYDKK